MSHEQYLALERLFSELFADNYDLLLEVRRHCHADDRFVAGLPPADSTPPAIFRMKLVDRLREHQIVDAELFAILRTARPAAAGRIAEAACRLGIQGIPSEGLVGASPRPGRGTHVVTLEAPIAGVPSAIDDIEVQAALALDREVTRRCIGLNDLDPGGGDPGTWSRGQDRIRDAVGSYLAETVCTSDARHVSIFGIAPIPWLMALGYAISETVPSRVFTRLREPASWTWEDDRPELGRWSARRLGGGAGARRAVILISASAEVQQERVEEVLPASGCVTYEIRLSQPRLDAVRSEAQLGEFGRVYRGVLNDVERLDRDVEEIHLFVAAPVAIAVDCGRRILHSATPPVVTYHFTARGYVRALTLES